MTDRVVNVKLKADISEYTSSLAKAAAATRMLETSPVKIDADISRFQSSLQRAAASTKALGSDIDRGIQRDVDPVLNRSGDRSGGVLAEGIRGGLIRKSPLIAAAVGGALVAGAPVALAGAAMLFGGIAGVAGAQAVVVRKAWTDLGKEISAGAVSDAAVVIPELVGMADELGNSFQRLRPQLREAFEATAPLVETFTDALTGAAENAMPGLIDAVRAGEPVMAGFQSFMESVGTGLSDMFGGLAAHAPAAGDAFAAIGDVVEELLPLIGTFLGQGAELAQVILPPVADVLGVVADVAERLGPLLPAIVAGFAGMKIAQAVSTGLGSLSDKLANIGALGDTASRGVSSLSGWMGRLGGAAAIVTGALAVTSSAASDSERRIEEWAQAAALGGQQATEAFAAAHEEAGGWFGGIVDWVNDLAGVESSYLEFGHDAVENLTARTREVQAAMSDTEKAQARVAAAQDLVTEAVDKFGANSPQAIAAVDQYEAAQRNLERQEDETRLAIDGVTTAMLEQADQAMAAIDSSFAYRNSTNQLEDAQDALAEAVVNLTNKDETLRTSQEDVERAQLLVEEQAYRTAVAYGQQQADLSGLEEGSAAYTRFIQTSMLEELYRLRDAAGPEMRGAIDTQIRALEASGVSLDETGHKSETARLKIEDYTTAIRDVPPAKTTTVNAETGQAMSSLADLRERINEVARNRSAVIDLRAQMPDLNGSASGTGRMGTYAEGGWTGPGGKYDPAGIVHADEFVFTKEQTRRIGVRRLEEIANNGYADGGLVKLIARGDTASAMTGLGQVDRATANAIAATVGAMQTKYATGSLGTGSVAGHWTSLWATIRAAFPESRLNSSYRPGDPGFHGAGRAVDLGWSRAPGGIGNAYMASMNRWIHDRYGANTKELIYDGLGDDRPDLKNGRPLTYSASTRNQHRNHVHWAMANGGVIGEPVAGIGMWSGGSYSFGERGPETVLPGIRGREYGSGGGAAQPIIINSPITFAGPVYGEVSMRQIAESVVDARDAELARNVRSALS